MIRVSGEFLDFNEEIEVEKQIKLFEDISTTDGDFSYQFDLPKTLNNTRILQNPFPDNISKPVYQRINADLLSNSGAELYKGYLRIERVTNVYAASFFAGNNNWFAEITGLLSDLDLDRYDVEQTQVNIENSWLNTEGIIFPLVDNGSLLTRSSPHLKVEDFVGAFYVKTIFNKVFAEAGIKIQGELLDDWRYNNMICQKNSKSQAEIDARSSYVLSSGQSRTEVFPEKVLWNDDSTFPYFDGDQDNFDLPNSRYVSDVKQILNVEVNLRTEKDTSINQIYLYINGVELKRKLISFTDVNSATFLIPINGGDVLEIYSSFANAGSNTDPILSGTLKITPKYIYKTFGNVAVPNWTKQQFVSNILRIFNVLASYNEGTATLTLNLFEKIKDKPPIDLSEYISEVETDYAEFISDYGQNSKLSYNEVEFDELKSYNTSKYFKYAQGVIQVNNDFLEQNEDILQSDFSNPIAYINGVFDMSMERTNLIELDEGDKLEFTGVSDSGGTARFAIPEDIYLVGDLMRIEESTNVAYNGEWVVNVVGAGFVELQNVGYDTNATGTIIKLDYNYADSDDVFLFINVPNYVVSKFSGNLDFRLEQGSNGTIAMAYFDLIHTGRQVNHDFIYSLSFGGIDDPLHYQVTMIESYFRLFGRVLNDPVKLLASSHLPYGVFNRIDFLSPVTIKTLESSNQYYMNRITGFKESYLSSNLELIKLP